MSYYTILTALGQAKLVQALGLGSTVAITHMALGDGNGVLPTPTEAATALTHEVYRAGINSLTSDAANPNWLVAELVVPTPVGGWTVREIGLYDTDGGLFAIGNFPPTYKPILAEGSAREITIRCVMQVANAATVTLVVDPSVTFATRTYVEAIRDTHAGSRNHPEGTTAARGFLRLATGPETRSGTDVTIAVSPGGLATLTATTERRGLVSLAPVAVAVAGLVTDQAVTPDGLNAHVSAALSAALTNERQKRATRAFLGQG